MALDFPSNPVDGEVFDAYVWSAAKGVWQSREESAAVAIMSPTTPTSATPGDIWVNTSDGTSFVYYDDGSTSQWVELISSREVDISGKANLTGGNTFSGIQTFSTALDIASGGTGAGTVAQAQANLQIPLSPNYIINGAFDIWQRGTSISTSGGGTSNYACDGWRFGNNNAAGQYSISRAINTSGAPGAYAMRLTSARTDASINSVEQLFEYLEVEIMRNKVLTLSFWVRSSTATSFSASIQSGTLTTDVYPGVGNAMTGQSILASQTINSTTTWQRVSVTSGVVPDSAGQLRVTLLGNTSITNGVWIEFAGVQLEDGAVATTFRRNSPSIQAELATCQRYYQRIDSSAQANRFLGSVAYYQGTLAVALVPLITQMRKIPIVSISAANTFQLLTAQANLTASAVSVNASDTSPTMLAFDITTSTITTTAAASFRANNTVNTRIEASAEL